MLKIMLLGLSSECYKENYTNIGINIRFSLFSCSYNSSSESVMLLDSKRCIKKSSFANNKKALC